MRGRREDGGYRCIGHGDTAGVCENLIGALDLEMNPPGLWCRFCETARRNRISAQLHDLQRAFEKPTDDGRLAGRPEED